MELLLELETDNILDIDYTLIINKVISQALLDYHFPKDVELSVVLTDNAHIQAVNYEFRNINRATDVLSFPMLEFEKAGEYKEAYKTLDCTNLTTGTLLLGDIMISQEKVIEQAERFGHSRQRELAFLVAHSMLHLFGFDHIDEEERKIMEERQEIILQKCGYTRD